MSPSSRKPPLTFGLLLAAMLAVAAGISLYLLIGAWREGVGVAGCGPGSGCDRVLSSPWSRFVVVPVALPASALYLLMLAAAVVTLIPRFPPAPARWAWRVLLFGAAAAAGAAVWFTVLQLAVVKAVCPYCMVVHVCGLLSAGLVLLQAPLARSARDEAEDAKPIAGAGISPRTAVRSGLAALEILAILILWQWQYPASTHHLVIAGDLAVDTRQYPLLGRRGAPHRVVLLLDYTCPHCRALARDLDAALDRYRGQLAVAVAPAPVEHTCNRHYQDTDAINQHGCEYARLALWVWRQHPSEFAVFHRWLEGGDPPPAIEVVRQQVTALGGPTALADAAADPWISDFIQQQIELNSLLRQKVREAGQKVGEGVPNLLIGGGRIIAGRPDTRALLFQELEAAGLRAGP